MANLCYNELHVAGPAERVEEFRIFNGQYIEPLEQGMLLLHQWCEPEKHPENFPCSSLVGVRNPNGLSYQCIAPIADESTVEDRHALWGAKWDVADDTWPARKTIDKSPLTIPYGEVMQRCHSIGFDSQWGPPSYWFEKLDLFSPFLTISMGYEERGNGVAGNVYWRDGEHYGGNKPYDELGREGVVFAQARVIAREGMPKKAKIGKLVKNIIDDEVSGTLQNLTTLDQNGLVDGMWPPLMYAARAGSTKAFNALIKAGQDLTWQSPCGVGIIDILMDVYPHQPVALVEARFDMIAAAMNANPSLASRHLASGVSASELAARLSLLPVLKTISQHGGLDTVGTYGGWIKTVAGSIKPDIIAACEDLIPPNKQRAFFSQIALHAVEKSNSVLLEAALDACPVFDSNTNAALKGLDKLPNGLHASDKMQQFYSALLAKKAIIEIVRGPLPTI